MKFAYIFKAFSLACIFLPAAAYSQFCGLPQPPTVPDDKAFSAFTPVTADSDPNEVVELALAKLHAARSYRLRTVSGGTTVQNMDYVYPNRLRWGLSDNPDAILMVIGNQDYRKNEKGSWIKENGPCTMPSDFGGYGPYDLSRRIQAAVKEGQTIRRIGPDTIDGKPVIAYQIIVKYGDPVTLTMWIGTQDNLPYKVEFRDKFPFSVATYSGYNTDIKIESPI